MHNYRNKGTFWLMDHRHEVALDLSKNNPNAAVAITLLLEDIGGVRAFGCMNIDLSPEEWDKLYHMCDGDSRKISSNVIAINIIANNHEYGGERKIHKNFESKNPVLFTEELIPDHPLWLFKDYKDREKFEEECAFKFFIRAK